MIQTMNLEIQTAFLKKIKYKSKLERMIKKDTAQIKNTRV